MVDVYEYLDYRTLLRDLYKDRKKKNPIVSYRYLGQKAGFKSAGYFANVLNGKCNISTTNAFKLAEVFKLKKHEMEYLGLLVQYATTSDPQEKSFFFEKIISQKKSKLKKLHKQQYEFFNNWFYLAIREIL